MSKMMEAERAEVAAALGDRVELVRIVSSRGMPGLSIQCRAPDGSVRRHAVWNIPPGAAIQAFEWYLDKISEQRCPAHSQTSSAATRAAAR